MLRRLLVVGLVGVFLAVPGLARAGTVAIFYYPWYGTPKADGSWQHWNQNHHHPPRQIYSRFFPARGPYSSSSRSVVNAQMTDIAAAGVDEVVISWWGRGSIEDKRLPLVFAVARKHGLEPAIHLEPYAGRTPATVASDLVYLAGLGVHDVYVYRAQDFTAAEWAPVLANAPPSLRLFAATDLVGFAAAAGFDGFYTYDFIDYGGSKFARLCTEAHAVGLLCAPSVGPGYNGIRAGEARNVLRGRRHGQTYDALWKAALDAHPDLVTITSYNEWGEGTQIEPAVPHRGYLGYQGAWGLRGPSAAEAYLMRTAYWAARFHAGQ